ncbi:MAG: hypothetical protein LBL34_02755, partial [Clostridiales bacterium]|nr:hypothetical protein [Clostridiales bacterium]
MYSRSTTIGVSSTELYYRPTGYDMQLENYYRLSGGSGRFDDPYAFTSNFPPKTSVVNESPVLSTTTPIVTEPITIYASPEASGETKVYEYRIGSGNWQTLSTTTATSITYTPLISDVGSTLSFRINYDSCQLYVGTTREKSTSAVVARPVSDATYTPVLPSTTTTVGDFSGTCVSLFLLIIKPVFNIDVQTPN